MFLRRSGSLLVLVLLPFAGCASGQPSASSPAPTPAPTSSAPTTTSAPAVPQRLDCRGGMTVSTDGGLMEAGAVVHGSDTPQDAVEGFLRAIDLAGYDYVVDGPEAWALRPDGSAVARMDFLLSDGWSVHGYEQCVR